ncbi:MAG: hypothetical protein ABJN39_09270 [Sulfitobacter sp.]|uniref:hypothetical protein n=1 Tax=Alphaproteobacteria TaxID=28211 RepID=UPI00294249AD|nr:hypothetical protein [Sulfitobacter sp. LC.270.F.C4]WOI13564.1 hypothetical protein R1T45_01670 [Sulfitobacter sp. LC.270.F.C4]
MTNFSQITPEEAYNQLNDALNAVRKRHPDNLLEGPNAPAAALATARMLIQELQMALLIRMEGLDPASFSTKGTREVTIRLKPDEAEALSEYITDTNPQPTAEAAALTIVKSQLRKLGYLE